MTTPSSKSIEPILVSPKQTPSTPWLGLEILSIKVMKKISDKGQPWQSPTFAGNKSNLLPVMWTKLWYRSHREWTHIRGTNTRKSQNPSQIHKTHVDRFSKLPCTLKDTDEGVELVHCSASRTKTTLFLLNPRFGLSSGPSSLVLLNRHWQGGWRVALVTLLN